MPSGVFESLSRGHGLRQDALAFGGARAGPERSASPSFEDGLAVMGAVDVSGSLQFGAHEAFRSMGGRGSMFDSSSGGGSGGVSVELATSSDSSLRSPPAGANGSRKSLRERAGLAPTPSPRSSSKKERARRASRGMTNVADLSVQRDGAFAVDDHAGGLYGSSRSRKGRHSWWLKFVRVVRLHGLFWWGCWRRPSCACPHILLRNTNCCGDSRGFRALMRSSDLTVFALQLLLLMLILLDASLTGVFFANSCIFMWCVYRILRLLSLVHT